MLSVKIVESCSNRYIGEQLTASVLFDSVMATGDVSTTLISLEPQGCITMKVSPNVKVDAEP